MPWGYVAFNSCHEVALLCQRQFLHKEYPSSQVLPSIVHLALLNVQFLPNAINIEQNPNPQQNN